MDSLSPTHPDGQPTHALQLVRAFVVLLVVDLAVRVLPFQRMLQVVRWLSTPTGATKRVPLTAVTNSIERAGKVTRWAHCVPRTLACHILVRRAGYPCAVIFGVARATGGALVAHAWPESDGHPLIGPMTGDYTYTRLAPLDL